MIDEYYAARRYLGAGRFADAAAPYNPVPIDRLFLTAADGIGPGGAGIGVLSPFMAPPEADSASMPAAALGGDFTEARRRPASTFSTRSAAHRRAPASRQARPRRRVSRGSAIGWPASCASTRSPRQARRGMGRGAASSTNARSRWRCWRSSTASSRRISPSSPSRTSSATAWCGAAHAARVQNFLAEASSLTPGDLVVHIDHGIGRYEGLKTMRSRRAA